MGLASSHRAGPSWIRLQHPERSAHRGPRFGRSTPKVCGLHARPTPGTCAHRQPEDHRNPSRFGSLGLPIVSDRTEPRSARFALRCDARFGTLPRLLERNVRSSEPAVSLSVDQLHSVRSEILDPTLGPLRSPADDLRVLPAVPQLPTGIYRADRSAIPRPDHRML